MAASLPDDVKALLDGPNFAHLATLRKNGTPQVDPVWVGREGNRILIGTGERTVKASNALRDPNVALSIVGFRDPYDEAMIRGRIVERRPDPDLVVMGNDPLGRTRASRFPGARVKAGSSWWSKPST